MINMTDTLSKMSFPERWKFMPLRDYDPPGECGVYFIQCTSGYIKIGMTSDIKARFIHYQTHNPMGCRLVGYIVTIMPKETEEYLHYYFDPYRVGGEWFAPCVGLVHYITNFIDGRGNPLEEIDENDLLDLPKTQERLLRNHQLASLWGKSG
jgi:hypothetical protein